VEEGVAAGEEEAVVGEAAEASPEPKKKCSRRI
jgi:hypothetical protein